MRIRNGQIGPLTSFFFSPSQEAFYFAISLALKSQWLIPFHLHPTVTSFVVQLTQMKLLSPAEMVKQPSLMFLFGPEMWMFTVSWGLVIFLQHHKSIDLLIGTHQPVRKAYCDNGRQCVSVIMWLNDTSWRTSFWAQKTHPSVNNKLNRLKM